MNQYNDTILELVEVVIHAILFARKVYSAKIFKKVRAFSAPTMISIYRPLNEYITNVLDAAKSLIQNGTLRIIEIELYEDVNTKVESYKFEIDVQTLAQKTSSDLYLIDLEEQFRSLLYNLDSKFKHLRSHKNELKFKINLHTSQMALVKLTDDPNQQKFPWIQTEATTEHQALNSKMVPLSSEHIEGVELYCVEYI